MTKFVYLIGYITACFINYDSVSISYIQVESILNDPKQKQELLKWTWERDITIKIRPHMQVTFYKSNKSALIELRTR